MTLAPRCGDRSLFPSLDFRVYLSHAAISPSSSAVVEAARTTAEDFARDGINAWQKYRDQRESLRSDLADLIGADAENIGLLSNTTQGVTNIALCFPWCRGDRIVVFSGEFPTNVTPWQRAAELFELNLVVHDADAFRTDEDGALHDLEQSLRDGVRLLAVSAVQFHTGHAMPLARIARLCRTYNAELFVDAIQAVGAMPLNVKRLDIDYLACGSHKWLMGMEGGGFVYVHPDRVTALRPHVAGWLSHEGATDMLFAGGGHLRYDRPVRNQVDFFEAGSLNSIGFAALGASVKLLMDLGVNAISRHIQSLLDELERGFFDRGFTSLRVRDERRPSPILALLPPPDLTVAEIRDGLAERGICTTMPDGKWRLAPHWPNPREDATTTLAAFDAWRQSRKGLR